MFPSVHPSAGTWLIDYCNTYWFSDSIENVSSSAQELNYCYNMTFNIYGYQLDVLGRSNVQWSKTTYVFLYHTQIRIYLMTSNIVVQLLSLFHDTYYFLSCNWYLPSFWHYNDKCDEKNRYWIRQSVSIASCWI